MDDKTTKIPSLKEFQQSQADFDRRRGKKPSKSDKAKAKKAINGDTHRIYSKDNKHEKSQNTSKSKSYSVGSTQKINSDEVRYNFRQSERGYSLENFEEKPVKRESQPLTQRRVTGQRPTHQRSVSQSTQQRPHQGSHSQSSLQQRQSQSRDAQRTPQQRGAAQSYQHRSRQHTDRQKSVNRASAQNLQHRSSKSRQSASSKAKKHKKPLTPFQRKVKRVIWYILIVAGFLLVGLILSMTVLFKTENIIVNIPEGTYTVDEIISASGLRYEDNIFMAGKEKAEKALEGKFPYIKSVEVKAVIPDTIKIDIVLSEPAYAVKSSSLTYIANEDSKVLEVVATADEVDVPIIEGVFVGSAKAGENLQFESELVKDTLGEMFNFAKEMGYKNITRVDIETQTTLTGTQTIDIRYVYDDRIVVYMGLPENISYKMQTAQTIITEEIDVNNTYLTGELDVSMSYDTKKSYFNQYTLIPDVVVTEPATETTSAEDENYY